MSILGNDIEALELSEGQRVAVVELLRTERKHAARWWTCLDVMRSRGELPAWAAAGTFGRDDEHDAWLASQSGTDGMLGLRSALRQNQITF